MNAWSNARGPFPKTRLRRLRRQPWIRELTQEHRLSPSDLIWPLFVLPGEDQSEAIASMPGVHRHSVDRIVKQAEAAVRIGIPAIAIFPVTPSESKSEDAAEAFNSEGVEMGAMVALTVATQNQDVKAIALDSVPPDSDGVLKESVEKRFPFVSSLTTKLAGLGTYLYFFDGCYKREAVCDTARRVENRNILLLAGVDAQDFQTSTTKLAKCFPVGNKIESKLDLSPSGFSIINASMEQSEIYDQRLIDFFRNSLSN